MDLCSGARREHAAEHDIDPGYGQPGHVIKSRGYLPTRTICQGRQMLAEPGVQMHRDPALLTGRLDHHRVGPYERQGRVYPQTPVVFERSADDGFEYGGCNQILSHGYLTFPAGLGPRNVLSRAGVYSHHVAGLDEERYLDDRSRLEDGVLRSS